MASAKDVRIIHEKLSKLMERPHSKYGGLHIVFSGDFRQLEPVRASSATLYRAKNCTEWHQWINSHIMLDGRWRFRDDPGWGNVMMNCWKGTVTDEDFDNVDSRMIGSPNRPTLNDIPKNCHYAVYSNKD